MQHAASANVLIHEFDPEGEPVFDDEGDQMIGFYYQFIDNEDNPLTDLIGPYRDNLAVERAAQAAFYRSEF